MNANGDQQERVRENFRSELLSLRRRMLGLSQTELAKISGISQGSLSKMEQGIKEVSVTHMEMLAQALKCPASFFFQPEREYGPPLSMHDGMYRKGAVSVKAIDKIIAELNTRIAHARTLLKSSDFDPELPLPFYEPEDYQGDFERIAQNVRRAWLMPRGPVKNLTDYMERAGVLIVKCDMSDARIDGVSYQIGGLPPIIFLNDKMPADRERFTLAHELGHLVMHKYPTENMEAEANSFAAAFLMPELDIAPDLKGITLEKAAALKPYWKVSVGSILYKAKTLKSVDDSQMLYLWRKRSAMGWNTREPESLDFPNEQPTLLSAMLQNMQSDLSYSLEELAAAMHLHLDEVCQMYGIKRRPILRSV
jgi:Zn-dependent peptidase ImmA (M78 family)/DNA-binding XRE family transcriptional regulator